MTVRMQALLRIVLLSGAVVGVSSCNTIEGAGEDIQEGGEAVEEAAEETGEALSDD